MSDLDDMNLDDMNLDDLIDDDFDYQKEIEAIEAQERELELQRQRKKQELENLRLKREQAAGKKKKAEPVKTEPAASDREQKKEDEWLGTPVKNEPVETVRKPKKKKSKAPLVLFILLLLIAAGLGGFYVIQKQTQEKTISAFSDKVEAFKAEKLQGADLGAYQAYFDDFMAQCDQAIEAGDLKMIAQLNDQWNTVAGKFSDVSNGKNSIESFVKDANEALSLYTITSAYEDTYNELMADIKEAQENCDFEQIADLQKRVDGLETNLKSANMKKVQSMKNDISALDLDEDFVKKSQRAAFSEYEQQVENSLSSGDYASAIATLKVWRKEARALAEKIEASKAAEKAKAESEAEAIASERAEAESRAQSEAESRALESAQKATETKAPETQAQTQKATTETKKPVNNNPGTGAEKGDYVLKNSSTAYLTDDDVKNLSSEELMYARNEIYARHGYIFQTESIRKHFESNSWYHGTETDAEKVILEFNDYEEKNLALIKSYE